jgi:hypothetical protein
MVVGVSVGKIFLGRSGFGRTLLLRVLYWSSGEGGLDLWILLEGVLGVGRMVSGVLDDRGESMEGESMIGWNWFVLRGGI